MDEDWDEPSTNTTASNNNYGVVNEGGRKFTAGRGFTPAENKNDFDGWGQSNSNDDGDDGGWGGGNSNNSNGFRGRGGRGGRGGGRGGFNRNDDENGFNSDSRGRGRGGRGGGHGGGGRGGFSNSNNGFDNAGEGGDAPEKPKEHYIPVENNDDDLFATGITTGINFMKLQGIEVNVSGENVPKPITSFDNCGLRDLLVENIMKSKYTNPTPIQKYSIPIVLNGRDLMGCAQTGSGKTAAFLIPIINTLIASKEAAVIEGSCSFPNVVIVSPTRELAIQIYEQARKFSMNSIVKSTVIYGGTSTNHQRSKVESGCHILVATPGRLNDFVNRQCISFSNVKFFVLDEADRMLDMGFLPSIEQMLSHGSMTATGERQTLMFSATFPEEIQHLAGKFLHNYVFVAVGIVGSASTDVEQKFLQVTKFDKKSKLLEILREDPKMRTLVFVETKRNADFLAAFLSENDIKTTSIHGDRLQREREIALFDFKKGICPVMVATGVAARGLDIDGVQHVINFDLPNSVDEYVHRIGRTGRVGHRGKATSFFDPSHDSAQAGHFSKIMKQAGQEVPDWLSSGDFGGQSNFGGRDIRGSDFGRAQPETSVEEAVEEW